MNVRAAISILALLCATLATAAWGADKGTVLVTGANRGLGLEFVKQLTADGYKVIGTARKPARATGLKATGARVETLDVASQDSVDALASAARRYTH